MKEFLVKKFQDLQLAKNTLLQELENYTEEDLNKRANSNKWSVAQVLFHIYMSESLTLRYLQKKINAHDQLKKAGIKAWVRSKMLKIFLILPIKYKAPKTIASPPEIIDWNRLLKDWENCRGELNEFIINLPDELLPMAIFKHPMMGMLTMSQTLDFLAEHFNHHLPQIKNHSSIAQSA